MIDRLIDILRQEAALFESFLELLEQQQQMLVNNDVEGLNRVTLQQQERLRESQNLNRQREEIIEHIKQANAVEGDLNVTRLIEMVDQDRAHQLIKLRDLIQSLNDKITTTRNQNALLLNRSREYIAKTMEMLSRINAHSSTYGESGVQKESLASVAVDRIA
ncbi:MAG: flagellar protein FlgN [Candidatus Zixiibacteriota bacterium]